MKKCIFISGVHGVGKNYILEKIQTELLCRVYEASSLIRKVKTTSDENKLVRNVIGNQYALIESIEKHVDDDIFVLNGHSVIINSHNEMERISVDIFQLLNIERIVLIVEEVATIHKRLAIRNKYNWDFKFIERFQREEIKYMQEVSKILDVELYIFQNSDELGSLIKIINGDREENVLWKKYH